MAENKRCASPVVTALIQGPDAKGLIATITGFIFEHKGNIVYLDQHTDPTEDMFFMRLQFCLEGFAIPREELDERFGAVCGAVGMGYRLFFSDVKRRVAILASKQGHCLLDLLYRWRSGHLGIEIPAIISNHREQRAIAGYYDIPYYHFPVEGHTREEHEEEILSVLGLEQVDTIVLARYMQILSEDFVATYPSQIINIHHSFLPAFVGANPYRQAFQRGVKIIGATSHYVTEKLDEGPIIAQDVIGVSHRDDVESLKRKGQDIERIVLARAVTMHVENRVLVQGNKTIVFGD